MATDILLEVDEGAGVGGEGWADALWKLTAERRDLPLEDLPGDWGRPARACELEVTSLSLRLHIHQLVRAADTLSKGAWDGGLVHYLCDLESLQWSSVLILLAQFYK